MQIHTITRGLHLTERESEYIATKMEKISHLAKRIQDESSEIRVEIDRNETKAKEDQITCIITLFIPRETLRAEAHGTTVMEAVDLAKPKLIQQIERYKEKWG